MTGTIEKRRHPRVAAEFVLRFEPQSFATVRDISRAGVRCISSEPLSAMTAVALRLEIPTPEGEDGYREVACRGVVVRNRIVESADGPLYEAAILFQDLDASAQQAIDGYVEHRISELTG